MRMGPWWPVASAQRAQRLPVTFHIFFFFFLERERERESEREEGAARKSEFSSLSSLSETGEQSGEAHIKGDGRGPAHPRPPPPPSLLIHHHRSPFYPFSKNEGSKKKKKTHGREPRPRRHRAALSSSPPPSEKPGSERTLAWPGPRRSRDTKAWRRRQSLGGSLEWRQSSGGLLSALLPPPLQRSAIDRRRGLCHLRRRLLASLRSRPPLRCPLPVSRAASCQQEALRQGLSEE